MITRIEKSFNDVLLQKWRRLFDLSSGAYNLNPLWCFKWCEFFLEEKSELHLICVYGDESCDELLCLMPFYKTGKKLRLIGSYPTFYDCGGVLFLHEKGLIFGVDFLLGQKSFAFDLKDMSGSGLFLQSLVRRSGKFKRKLSCYGFDVSPFVDCFKPHSKLRCSIKKSIHNAGELHGLSDVQLVLVEKSEVKNALLELEKQHKVAWGEGSFFVKRGGYFEFVENLLQSDVAVMYKLQSKEVDSVFFAILGKNSNRSFTVLLTTYNKDFGNVSIGKVGFFMLLEDLFKRDENCVLDFGRGAEDYKYFFSNKDNVLVSVCESRLIYKIVRLILKLSNFFHFRLK
jgi:hypothetical protein